MAGICLLSAEEVGRLQHYDLQPNHDAHKHLSVKQAARLLRLGKIEEVVDEKRLLVYATPTKLYVLKSKRSGHIRVIQRVVGTPMKHITPPSELDLSKE